MRATFFLVGRHVENLPERCDILRDAGHELGCHCYQHLSIFKATPWSILADIRKAYNVLEKWVGKDGIFRPPYGKLTSSLLLFLKLRNIRTCLWTIDGGDTYKLLPRPESIVEQVMKENGGVVLIHSFDRKSGPNEREEYVLSLTERLLESAREHGLIVATCSELD